MNIIDTNLKLDGNHLYELEITVDKLPELKEEVLFEDHDNKLVYGETPDGYVTYGSISKHASYGHGPGYRWSSRGSVFNGMFGKRCIEVTIIEKYRYAGAMTIDAVLPFLPDDFYIIEQVETDRYDKIREITYSISNPEHEKNNQWIFKNHTYSDGSKCYVKNRIYNNEVIL